MLFAVLFCITLTFIATSSYKIYHKNLIQSTSLFHADHIRNHNQLYGASSESDNLLASDALKASINVTPEELGNTI